MYAVRFAPEFRSSMHPGTRAYRLFGDTEIPIDGSTAGVSGCFIGEHTHGCKFVFCRVRTEPQPGVLPVPGTCVCSVRHSCPYPELLYVLYDIHARTRKFWMFCTTFIPVTGTCASSVRPWYKTRGAGTHLYNDPGAGYG